MIPIDAIIRTRRKSFALIIKRDGRLTVRAPLRASEKEIYAVVEKKADWIRAKQAWVKSVYPAAKPKEYVDGESFWYLGKILQLAIVDEKIPLLNLNGTIYLSRSKLSKAEGMFKKWYKAQAYKIISGRVEWYASRLGYRYQQVKITSARTRWGSCSPRGALSFPWRLVMAPVPVIDYVVVHELVHTQVKNHSKEFWGKVKAIMPDYKQHITWLKTNGQVLTLD
jgi:predicted metal-dependent hydrolase